MKDYIKPTFTLAGLAPVALAASCHNRLNDADLQALCDAMGYDINEVKGNTFAYGESCEYPVPSEYCKFTSSADTTGTVMTS